METLIVNKTAHTLALPTTARLFALLGLMGATFLGAVGCNSVQNQTLNAEGVSLYRQGAFPQAADKFQQAIAKKPNSADGYYNLAASLHQTGTRGNRPDDLRQAELYYNQCLERNNDHIECYRGLAVLLKETQRPDAAYRLLNNWGNGSPKNPNPKIELARLLEEEQRPEQAKAQLVAALTINPNEPRALAALGRLRDQSGNHQQALQNYQRSLAANSNQPQLAARVATLQSAIGAGTGPLMTTGGGNTRLANQWQSAPATRRY